MTQNSSSLPEAVRSAEVAPLVFPVGHYMGPFHPTQGAPAKHHIVRVGWNTPKLPDQAHFDMWALAHGLPSRLGGAPWTRQVLIETATEAEVPGAAEILDNLVRLGLTVEVMPGSDQAQKFAQAYRVRPLLIGLGNTAADPVLDGIGLAGVPPLVRVRPRVFEIWEWTHLWPSIWTACEGFASVANQAADASAEPAEPQALLDFMLDAFRTLIAHSAIYLDVVTTAPGRSASEGQPR
ncbi:MAG: hypothetical protein M3400_06310 [Actinomycetota bacterium]|nr:hypothetical protein [Actinomycetota bacterium]